MADPISIIAGAIGLTNVAFKSVKSLYDLIGSLRNVPTYLVELRDHLGALNKAIHSVKVVIADFPESELSADQSLCLDALQHAMKSCRSTCDDFEQRLTQLTSHSANGRVDWRDRARFHLNESDVTLFKSRLGDWRQTLSVALGAMTSHTMRENNEQMKSFRNHTEASLSNLLGKLEMVDLTLQTLAVAEQTGNPQSISQTLGRQTVCQTVSRQGDSQPVNRKEVAHVISRLNEQSLLLKQCVNVCTAGMSEASKEAGVTVLHARTFDDARQFIGNVGDVGAGGPPVHVANAEARNKSKQLIGNISVEAAREFFA